MHFRQILTIFACLLAFHHVEVVSVSSKQQLKRAVKPDDHLILPVNGESRLNTNHLDDYVTVSSAVIQNRLQPPPTRVNSTVNLQNVRNFLELLEPPPLTTQYRYDNDVAPQLQLPRVHQEPQINSDRQTVDFFADSNSLTTAADYSPRNRRASNMICPTLQIYQFDPPPANASTRRRSRARRDQRCSLPSRRAAHAPLQRRHSPSFLEEQQLLSSNWNFSRDYLICTSLPVVRKVNSISALNLFPYMYE